MWQRLHLGALVSHVFLSVLFTWPLALNLLPGSGTLTPGTLIVDRDQNLWNLWWVRQAVLSGHSPFVTDMIWYPTPVSLYYHTLNVFNGLLAIPLLQVFSLTTVYNLLVLFSFAVGGYGAFLLVRHLCGNRWAALIGSVVFAYSAYHIATMRGLLQLVSLEWMPFFVLFLLRAVYSPPLVSRRVFGRWLWRYALPVAVALFMVSLVDWYYTMYALMLAGFLGLYVLARGLWPTKDDASSAPWPPVGEPLARIAVCLGIYAVLVSPILIPMVRELRTTSYMQPAPDAALSYSADLLAFFQPPRFNHLWGDTFKNRLDWPFGNNDYEVYFTYTALLLTGVGLFASHQPRLLTTPAQLEVNQPIPGKWFWAACALVFFVLALGPVLQVNGHQIRWLFSPDFKLPMPYNLVERIPLLNISRSPDRFDMPLTLCLGVLSGYGAKALMDVRRQTSDGRQPAPSPVALRRTKGAMLAVGAIGLIALELAPMPYPQLSAHIPNWYSELGKQPGDFSILDLPPQDDYWHGAFRMYDQTAHGKHIFGGYISREFPHPFLQSTPGYQELTYVDGKGDMFKAGRDQWLSALDRYRTRYLVLQKEPYPKTPKRPPDISPSREAIRLVLGTSANPSYADGELEVYQVTAPNERVPFLQVGDDWEPRETNEQGDTYRWMHAESTLNIEASRAESAFLVFRASSLGTPRPLQIFYGNNMVFEGSVPTGLQPFRAGPLELPRGASTLRFVSPQGTTSPAKLGLGDDPRELSFVVLDAGLEVVR